MTTPTRAGLRRRRFRSRLGAIVAALALAGSTVVLAAPASAAQSSVTLESGRTTTLSGGDASSLDGTTTFAFAVGALPVKGGGLYSSARVRVTSAGAYALQTRLYPDGTLQAVIKRTAGSKTRAVTTAASSYSRLNVKVKPGDRITLKLAVSGTKAVRLNGTVSVGSRSSVKLAASDRSSSALTAAGAGDATLYVSASTPTLRVSATSVGFRAAGSATEPKPSTPPSASTKPAPSASAKPKPAPTTKPKPAPTSTPKPAPTTKPKPAPTSKPKPAPTSKPKPAPAPTQSAAPAPEAPPSSTSRPGPRNTGVPAGVNLRVHKGDLTITKANTVVDGVEVRGIIVIDAPGVVIRNSRIIGTSTPRTVGLVSNVVSGQPFTITDSEIVAASPSPYWNGIMGSNFTAERVNIHGVVDPVRVLGGNVTVRDSWLHDNTHFNSDPYQGGGPSHDDSIQIQAGGNIRIEGNRLEDAHNAGIQITQDTSRAKLGTIVITGNYLQGGACTVNIGRTPSSFKTVISKNVFGPQRVYAHCAVIAPTGNAPALTGNTWEQDGRSMNSFTPAS